MSSEFVNSVLDQLQTGAEFLDAFRDVTRLEKLLMKREKEFEELQIRQEAELVIIEDELTLARERLTIADGAFNAAIPAE